MKTLSEFVKYTKKAKTVNKADYIIDYCRNKKILDVGCVGQDMSLENDNWLHNKILHVSQELTGVDINTDGLNEMKNKNFQVFNVKELTNHNQRYDLIVMGDVIEHTNSPVEFLDFYKKFLNENGEIIITTPNFLSARNFITTLLFNYHSVNEEHTCWFGIKTFFEVCKRSGLQIKKFHWLKPQYQILGIDLTFRTIRLLSNLLMFLRKSFSESMLFIIQEKSND